MDGTDRPGQESDEERAHPEKDHEGSVGRSQGLGVVPRPVEEQGEETSEQEKPEGKGQRQTGGAIEGNFVFFHVETAGRVLGGEKPADARWGTGVLDGDKSRIHGTLGWRGTGNIKSLSMILVNVVFVVVQPFLAFGPVPRKSRFRPAGRGGI